MCDRKFEKGDTVYEQVKTIYDGTDETYPIEVISRWCFGCEFEMQKRVEEIDFESLKCEEASYLSYKQYIPCGNPAVAIIWHNRDGKHCYPMCLPCANHNIRNRGGILLGKKKGMKIL